eukprot:TRINITY_DN12993_c0_g1_i1.p1 TRINITY_DN12993_c0_g1~~TRINITY_DN12993_c0_g1_i1.p1  ORF type:complete len:326 (+),score=35.03 TRINITY_DN12993_c0_g1_i1:430-1407(+)
MPEPRTRVAIVTGANTGIGRETALALAKDGIKVFLACRSLSKADEAIEYILKSVPEADVEALELDLRTLESVHKCANQFKSKKLPLNILVNNAGAAMGTSWYTPEGVGGSAQVNFLGPYVLTRLLEKNLIEGAPSRVVNVSSITHRHARIRDADKFLRDFKSGLYGHTKLANVLFTSELQRRWGDRGVEAIAVDPGSVSSDIWRRSKYNRPPFSWVLKSAYAPTWDGAKAVIYSASSPLDSEKSKQGRPFKYIARGAFTWSVVTTAKPIGILHLFVTFLDWPLRWASRGYLCSQIKDVPAAPWAYDKELAATIWNKAGAITGFDQ